MGWPRRESATPIDTFVQGVTKTEFDEQMRKLDEQISQINSSKVELETAEKKLRQTVEDSKRARAELESSIAVAKRRGQGRW